LKEDGILLVDSSTVKTIPETKSKVFKIPTTQIAETALKDRLYANMVILGALTKTTQIVSEQSMEKAIEESVPKKATATNLRAYRMGLKQ